MPQKKQTRQTHLSRLFFLSKGCKQVPLEYARGIVRWGHPDGYFLNAQGQKVKDNFSPSSQNVRPNMHGRYPILRECVRECHILMALTFYGDRPIDPATGKPSVTISSRTNSTTALPISSAGSPVRNTTKPTADSAPCARFYLTCMLSPMRCTVICRIRVPPAARSLMSNSKKS
jgi:hypothetical protein